MRDQILTEFTADVRGFRRGANYVDRRVGELERSVSGRLDRHDARWRRSQRALDGFRGTLSAVVVTAGLLKFGRDSFNVAKDFEAAMNRIQAATGAPIAQMEALAQKSKELGRTTSFSASEVAGAAEMLQRNGLALTDVLGGALDASLRFAEATGGDIARAADLATDIMGQYGVAASELPAIVDITTAAVINSKFAFDDISQAIGQAGKVAALGGVEFDDLAVSLALTAEAFTSGSDAGTSFKNFVIRLSGVSSEARAEIERLGLQFYDAQGQLRSMAEVSGELQQAFGGMSESQRTASMQVIFGTDAMRTAATLAEKGADGFQQLADAMAQVSAQDQAEARMMGAEGAMKRLAAAWEGVLLSFGDNGGLAAQTAALDALAAALNFISENFQALGLAALSVAGSRGIGAITAAMRASNTAARATVAATAGQIKSTQRAVTAARAEVRLRNANITAMGKEAVGTKRYETAVRSLSRAKQQLAVASKGAMRASHAHDLALKRVTITARLAASTMGALRGAMAFFGGPIGLAITAITIGIAAFSRSGDDAAVSMERVSERVDTVERRIRSLQNATTAYSGLISGTANAQDGATSRIIAATEREFNAKKSLLELEIKRQRVLQAQGQTDLTQLGDNISMEEQLLSIDRGANQGSDLIIGNDRLDSLIDQRTRLTAELELMTIALENAETVLEKPFEAGSGQTPPAGGGGGGAGSEDGYSKLIAEINQRIEAQRGEAEALALTAHEADKLRAAREFLTMAERAGLELTPELRAEIYLLADAYASAAEEARSRAEAEAEAQENAANMSKEVSGAIKQMLSDLREGKSALESFLVIWQSFIAKITDKAIDSAVDAIFASTSGGGTGDGSGGGGGIMGFLGRLFQFDSGGAFGLGSELPINGVSNRPTMFNMGGGDLGVMGERRPEAIMPLVRNAQGDLAVQSVGGGGGAPVQVTNNIRVYSNDPNTRVEIGPSRRQSQRKARGMMGG